MFFREKNASVAHWDLNNSEVTFENIFSLRFHDDIVFIILLIFAKTKSLNSNTNSKLFRPQFEW